jgi:hypothetical protein
MSTAGSTSWGCRWSNPDRARPAGVASPPAAPLANVNRRPGSGRRGPDPGRRLVLEQQCCRIASPVRPGRRGPGRAGGRVASRSGCSRVLCSGWLRYRSGGAPPHHPFVPHPTVPGVSGGAASGMLLSRSTRAKGAWMTQAAQRANTRKSRASAISAGTTSLQRGIATRARSPTWKLAQGTGTSRSSSRRARSACSRASSSA